MAKTDSSNRWQRPNGQIQGIIVYCSLKNGGIAIISPAVKKDRWIVQVAKTDYEGENETYIEASVENSSSILYDKEIRNKPRTRRTKRNV